MIVLQQCKECVNVFRSPLDNFRLLSQHTKQSVEIFDLVTGHSPKCRSVELIQRVTVTCECRIDRNGTVVVQQLRDRREASVCGHGGKCQI